MAFSRVAGLINNLLGKPYEEDKNKVEDEFNHWLKNPNLPENEKVFVKLRDYLWKGSSTNKNSSGYVLTSNDKSLMIEMLSKLNEIRNFHSHYWHDNTVLEFSFSLKKHIQDLHDFAKLSLSQEFPKDVTKYEDNYSKRPMFKKHENKEFITKDGKAFFLSFFLTRGEMARFLQQHRGYKRNDTSEFKIKHLIYRYYTHRDGAARQHYGQEDNVLGTMTTQEQHDILSARQAFKLISYLNDVPFVSNDPALFPLSLDADTYVQNAEQLIAFCRANNLFEGMEMKTLLKEIKPKKGSMEAVKTILKEQFLEISINGFQIHVGRSAFHRLILDSIRNKDEGKLIAQKLQEFTEERQFLHQFITDKTFRENYLQEKETTFKEVTDPYYLFKLRSDDTLKKHMGVWLEQFEKTIFDNKFNEQFETFEEAILSSPIEVGYYDFYFEADDKPRAFDRFVSFAVQYLIDFEKVKDWYWMFERFEPEIEIKDKMVYEQHQKVELLVNKRRVMYSAKKPTLAKVNDAQDNTSDWRLAITDGQVVVGIYTDEPEEYRLAGKAPKHKFLLGHRALKNLLITSFEDKIEDNYDLNHFFEDIIADIDAVRNKAEISSIQDFKILTANELPISFKVALKAERALDTPQLRTEAKKRMERIIQKLTPFAELEKPKKYLSRAEKNRQIMRCYTFFDWQYPNDSKFKFLRQDEYQRMSVYHYCLEERKNNNLQHGTYAFLIKEAMPHIPQEIQALLRDAKNIDDLLANVARETIELLTNWNDILHHLKGKELAKRLAKLGISSNLNPELSDHIPFDVHPILILRKYYPDELSGGNFSLSRSLFLNKQARKGLRETHYEYEAYLAKYNVGKDAPKVQKKLIGQMNELITQDVLLWKIAKEYIQKTSSAYQSFIGNGKDFNAWKVSNLRQTEIRKEFAVNGYGVVKLNIKFHQLDDYLLVESTPVIALAIKQALMRFENPNSDDTNPTMQVAKVGKNYEVAYDEVFKEIQRVFNDSVRWAFFVLEWEKSVIDSMTNIEKTTLENNKISKGQKAHINFWEVCQKAGLPDDKVIRDLRNTAFHGKIPNGWAYWQKEQDTELCKLIGYQKKVKYDYENPAKTDV